MKRVALAVLALLLCVGAFGCAESQQAQNTFQQSAEGKLIGKTFREVEAAFGPFSMVYLEKDWPPMYLFSKTNVGFYFSDAAIPASWTQMQQSGTDFLPAPVALQSVRGTDVCTGVSGRIGDFDLPAAQVDTLSRYMDTFQLNSYETAANTVYTVTTADQTLDVFVFAGKGRSSVDMDDQIRVLRAGVMAASSLGTSDRRLPQLNGADVTSADLVAVGDLVTFGVYEQDNDLDNGPETLSWKVLKKSGKRLLLITDKIIDVRPFHENYVKLRWRSSDIRVWLNGEFMEKAFTEEERELIPEVELLDSGNKNYWIIPGSETMDRVFLLEVDEAFKYFKSTADRKATSTRYADARGFAGNTDGWWWLRNAGQELDHASLIYKDGSVYRPGDRVDRTDIGVRPALWVQIP